MDLTTEEIKVDKLIRSRRRTISLEIGTDGTLVVRAPNYASNASIREFIYKKRNWIADKIRHMKKKYGGVREKVFADGETFLYLGKPYTLSIYDKTILPLTIYNSNFILSAQYLENAREVFTAWYKERAREKCTERAEWYSFVSGLPYNKINISNAGAQWGSCSVNGNLNFTWRLIMAPLPVLDYIVIHELAHIREKNHSKRFWSIVSRLSPEYKKRRKWLAENDHLLHI